MLVAPLWIPMPCALYPRSQASQTGSENCHVSNTQNHKPGIRAQLGLCCMYLHVCVHAHMCGPTCIYVHVCVCSQLEEPARCRTGKAWRKDLFQAWGAGRPLPLPPHPAMGVWPNDLFYSDFEMPMGLALTWIPVTSFG